MEDSILTSTKKILGVTDTAFDLDILTAINATFAIVQELGLGPDTGMFISDETSMWGDIGNLTPNQLNVLKVYAFLRVRMLFDPPVSGFLLTALQQQIQEYEQRLSYMREIAIPIPIPVVTTYWDWWANL